MAELIVNRRAGAPYSLGGNRHGLVLSSIERSRQFQADDVIKVTAESREPFAFRVGDWFTHADGLTPYTLNQLPTVKREGGRYVYDLIFEGPRYELGFTAYDLSIDTVSGALSEVIGDALTGDLEMFARCLVANANRVTPGGWRLGLCPETESDVTLNFAGGETCLSALGTLCDTFKVEHSIRVEQYDAGDGRQRSRRVLDFAAKIGVNVSPALEYGRAGGLYSIERQNADAQDVVTVLRAYGSRDNITSKYRADRLCLPGRSRGESYISDAEKVAEYGHREGRIDFDDVKPTFTGVVTSTGGESFYPPPDPTLRAFHVAIPELKAAFADIDTVAALNKDGKRIAVFRFAPPAAGGEQETPADPQPHAPYNDLDRYPDLGRVWVEWTPDAGQPADDHTVRTVDTRTGYLAADITGGDIGRALDLAAGQSVDLMCEQAEAKPAGAAALGALTRATPLRLSFVEGHNAAGMVFEAFDFEGEAEAGFQLWLRPLPGQEFNYKFQNLPQAALVLGDQCWRHTPAGGGSYIDWQLVAGAPFSLYGLNITAMHQRLNDAAVMAIRAMVNYSGVNGVSSLEYFAGQYTLARLEVTALWTPAGVDGGLRCFTDSTMFDLNAKEPDGETTKYLINGITPKVHFNTGNLAGYEFDVKRFDTGTRTFEIAPVSDEQGRVIPSEEVAAFRVRPGDKYKLLDVCLPEIYTTAAEAKLLIKATEAYKERSTPRVKYGVELAPGLFDDPRWGWRDELRPGDSVKVTDAGLGVDKWLRVLSITEDLAPGGGVGIELGDVAFSPTADRPGRKFRKLESDSALSKTDDIPRSRRNWRDTGSVYEYAEQATAAAIEADTKATGAVQGLSSLSDTVDGHAAEIGAAKFLAQDASNAVNVLTTSVGETATVANNALIKAQAVETAAGALRAPAGAWVPGRIKHAPGSGSLTMSDANTTAIRTNMRYAVGELPADMAIYVPAGYRFALIGKETTGNTAGDIQTPVFYETGGYYRYSFPPGAKYYQAMLRRDPTGPIAPADWATAGVEIYDAATDRGKAIIAKIEAAESLSAAKSELTASLTSTTQVLQSQIDGEVSTWYGEHTPDAGNEPASLWLTEAEKQRHQGDVFTNIQGFVNDDETPNAGKSWRWIKEGAAYRWTAIADSDAIKALKEVGAVAGELAETATALDGKITTARAELGTAITAAKNDAIAAAALDATNKATAAKSEAEATAAGLYATKGELSAGLDSKQGKITSAADIPEVLATAVNQAGGRNYFAGRSLEQGGINTGAAASASLTTGTNSLYMVRTGAATVANYFPPSRTAVIKVPEGFRFYISSTDTTTGYTGKRILPGSLVGATAGIHVYTVPAEAARFLMMVRRQNTSEQITVAEVRAAGIEFYDVESDRGKLLLAKKEAAEAAALAQAEATSALTLATTAKNAAESAAATVDLVEASLEAAGIEDLGEVAGGIRDRLTTLETGAAAMLSDVDGIAARMTAAETGLAGKQDSITDLESIPVLFTALENKADDSRVTALQTTVAGKQDSITAGNIPQAISAAVGAAKSEAIAAAATDATSKATAARSEAIATATAAAEAELDLALRTPFDIIASPNNWGQGEYIQVSGSANAFNSSNQCARWKPAATATPGVLSVASGYTAQLVWFNHPTTTTGNTFLRIEPARQTGDVRIDPAPGEYYRVNIRRANNGIVSPGNAQANVVFFTRSTMQDVAAELRGKQPTITAATANALRATLDVYSKTEINDRLTQLQNNINDIISGYTHDN